MSANTTNGELGGLLEELKAVADDARRDFGTLSATQINWKPSAEQWSVGQCFDHLVISNRPYLPIIEEIRDGRRRRRTWERMPLLPRLFGRMLIKTLRPDSGRNVKARPAFQPSERPETPPPVTLASRL